MKRRSVLQSIVALPVLGAGRPASPAQKELAAGQQKGAPGGPPLVPPGINETPITPVATSDSAAESVSRTFNPDQLATLRKLGELIVPVWNELPGATEAGAAEFLDFLIGCSPKSRIDLYRHGLDALNGNARQAFGKNFAALSADEADTLLSPLRERWTFESGKADAVAGFLQAAKADLLQATVNSRAHIDAISQTRRPRNASRFYWYPIS